MYAETLTIEKCLSDLRHDIKVTANGVKGLKAHPDLKGDAPLGSDKGEVIANIMLSYRHLEDAAMRLGKALQALDGGVSCYNR